MPIATCDDLTERPARDLADLHRNLTADTRTHGPRHLEARAAALVDELKARGHNALAAALVDERALVTAPAPTGPSATTYQAHVRALARCQKRVRTLRNDLPVGGAR